MTSAIHTRMCPTPEFVLMLMDRRNKLTVSRKLDAIAQRVQLAPRYSMLEARTILYCFDGDGEEACIAALSMLMDKMDGFSAISLLLNNNHVPDNKDRDLYLEYTLFLKAVNSISCDQRRRIPFHEALLFFGKNTHILESLLFLIAESHLSWTVILGYLNRVKALLTSEQNSAFYTIAAAVCQAHVRLCLVADVALSAILSVAVDSSSSPQPSWVDTFAADYRLSVAQQAASRAS